MKITQSTLRRIIQEEIAAVTKESAEEYYMGYDYDDGRSSVTGKPTFKERERERQRKEKEKAKKSLEEEEDLDEDLDAAEDAEFEKRHLARLRALAAKRKEKEDREEAMRMASFGREEYPGERTSAVYREGSDATNKLKSLIVKVLKERKK